jgi:putative tricarboxylic transport membrane protein
MAVESFSSWVAGPGRTFLPLTAAYVVAVVWIFVLRGPMKQFAGRITLDTGLAATGFLAFVLTYGFPSMSFKGVDAALVPRVWASLLVALAVARLVCGLTGKDSPDPATGRLDKVFLLMALLTLKFIGITWVGYFISAGLFVFICGLLLGYKSLLSLALVAGGWVAFSYFIFYRLLAVPLPTGLLLTAIFR